MLCSHNHSFPKHKCTKTRVEGPITDNTTFQAFRFLLFFPPPYSQTVYKCLSLYKVLTSLGAILCYNAACSHFVLAFTVSSCTCVYLWHLACAQTKLPIYKMRLNHVFQLRFKPMNCCRCSKRVNNLSHCQLSSDWDMLKERCCH